MPNRILRDGILTSEAVNSLDWGAEVFFRRLMSVADDHGRYHALPRLLRAGCYPLHIDSVSDAHVTAWIDACCQAGLVERYVGTDGKVYLQIVKFGQQVRAKSKFPDADAFAQLPPTATDSSPQGAPSYPQKSPDSNCYQPPANAHLVGVVFGVGGEGVSENHCSPTASPNRASPASKSDPPIPEGFARFWEAVPNLGRKTGKGKALEVWRKNRLEAQADQIVAHVTAMGQTEGWRSGFQPLPATYLSQGRWDDPIPPSGPRNEARAYLEETINGHRRPADAGRLQPPAGGDAGPLRRGVPPEVAGLYAPGARADVVAEVLDREDPSERY